MVFDRVKKLRKEGKTPVIELTPGARIVKHKLPRGRPRKYPEGLELAARYVGRRGKHRPRCLARGCHQILRINQYAACSDACADRIINTALLHLKQCGVSKTDLVQMYEG